MGLLFYLIVLGSIVLLFLLFCIKMVKYRKLNVMNLNIGGVSSTPSKFKTFCNYMIENEIDICCLQEWKLNHEKNKNVKFKFELPKAYTMVVCGVTAIIYKEEFEIIELSQFKFDNNSKHYISWLGIYSDSKAYIFGSYYRSPSGDDDPAEIQNLITQIDKYVENECIFILNGDFNATHVT